MSVRLDELVAELEHLATGAMLSGFTQMAGRLNDLAAWLGDASAALNGELQAGHQVVEATRYLLAPQHEPSWGKRIERLAEAIADYNDAVALPRYGPGSTCLQEPGIAP